MLAYNRRVRRHPTAPAAGQVNEVAAWFIFLQLKAVAMNRGRGSEAGMLSAKSDLEASLD